MFYINLGSANDKVNCYVMHKHMINDTELLAKKFEMDASPPKLKVESFPNNRKELVIDMIFP